MSKKTNKIIGDNEAKNVIKEIGFLVGTNAGAAWIADEARVSNSKSKAITNSQVLDYLAEGGRSLYPSVEEINKAGDVIMNDIHKHLKKTGRIVSNRQGISKRLLKKDQALAGLAAGLNKSIRFLKVKMYARLKLQRTTNGVAKKVSDHYARRRHARFGVNESVVYIASRQLANALANGKVKVFLKDVKIDNLLKNIK